MRSKRRFGITAMTAAIALSLGAVPVALTVPSILADPAETTTVESADATTLPTYLPVGWLALDTGTTNQTTFTKASPYPGTSSELPVLTNVTTEPLYGLSGGQNGCLLSTLPNKLDQNERLLAFSATAPGSAVPNAASLLAGSIGAAEKKSGASCASVESGSTNETLTLTLNQKNLKTVAGGLLASSALLDLELKGTVEIIATAYRGSDKVGTFRLLGPNSSSSEANTFICPSTSASDSGSDSGVNDNCRWPISAPSWGSDPDDGIAFDKLVFEPISGAFSLEGGSDGLVPGGPPITSPFPPRSSIVELVQPYEGKLTCYGPSVSEPGAQSGSGSEPYIKVTRIGNADVDETCEPVAYSLANALKQATFYKPLDQQGSAQFIVEMEWTIPANTTSTANPLLPETRINYESTLTSADIPLRWCPDLVADPASGFKVVENITSKSALDQDSTLIGTQFACLISSDATDVAGKPGDFVTLKQVMYLYGDARFSSP